MGQIAANACDCQTHSLSPGILNARCRVAAKYMRLAESLRRWHFECRFLTEILRRVHHHHCLSSRLVSFQNGYREMDRMANAVIRNSERAELKRIRAASSRRGGSAKASSKDGGDNDGDGEENEEDGEQGASSAQPAAGAGSADWLLRAMGMQPSSGSGTKHCDGTQSF